MPRGEPWLQPCLSRRPSGNHEFSRLIARGTAVFVFGEDRSNEEFPRSKQINWKIFVSDLILMSIER